MFDAARGHLVDELGVEPGRDLQLLHRAVLDHDPDLDWTPRGTLSSSLASAPSAVPPTSLPASTTRLIGREREMARIVELLAENRMLTLTGPGGIGKTRLALAVAERAANERPVWLVELAELDDPAVVPYEVARAVGVTDAADPTEALQVRIGDQPGLLVLDTCEHLLDVCADTAHGLLRRCPALRILATSRQPLSVPGEVAWPLRPLALPPVAGSFDELHDAEAVRLFVDRGRAVQPDFELEVAQADDVARICRLLDGLPLAIELAAARVAVLSPSGILRHLDDRFALLSRVGRAADVRQRSMRTAIAWSYDLLDDEQRVFFARLGTFPGRFTYAAAVDVAAHDLHAQPLDLLSAMVDRSLLVVDGDESYRLLESLRAFAVECLDRHPSERDAARERLARWLATSCDSADRELRGPPNRPRSTACVPRSRTCEPSWPGRSPTEIRCSVCAWRVRWCGSGRSRARVRRRFAGCNEPCWRPDSVTMSAPACSKGSGSTSSSSVPSPMASAPCANPSPCGRSPDPTMATWPTSTSAWPTDCSVSSTRRPRCTTA